MQIFHLKKKAPSNNFSKNPPYIQEIRQRIRIHSSPTMRSAIVNYFNSIQFAIFQHQRFIFHYSRVINFHRKN